MRNWFRNPYAHPFVFNSATPTQPAPLPANTVTLPKSDYGEVVDILQLPSGPLSLLAAEYPAMIAGGLPIDIDQVKARFADVKAKLASAEQQMMAKLGTEEPQS